MSETASGTPQVDPTGQMLGIAQRGLGAATEAQKELLAVCEEAGKSWADRFQTEMNFCADTMAELAATRSPPEFLTVYSQCLGRRFRMAAEDAQHMFQDCLHASQALTRPFLGGGSEH